MNRSGTYSLSLSMQCPNRLHSSHCEGRFPKVGYKGVQQRHEAFRAVIAHTNQAVHVRAVPMLCNTYKRGLVVQVVHSRGRQLAASRFTCHHLLQPEYLLTVQSNHNSCTLMAHGHMFAVHSQADDGLLVTGSWTRGNRVIQQ